jgi:hypothetical protein
MERNSTKYTLLLDWANYAYSRAGRAAEVVLQRPHTRQLHELFELARSTALQEAHLTAYDLSNTLKHKLKPGIQQVAEAFLTLGNEKTP